LVYASTRTKTKRGNTYSETTLQFRFGPNAYTLQLSALHATWLQSVLPLLHPSQAPQTISTLQKMYAQQGLEDFELFWVNELREINAAGLLVI
jgi:hypothetical protein